MSSHGIIIGSTAILKDNNWKQSILPNILFPLIDINEMGNFCRIALIIPTDHFNGVLAQNPYTLYSMFDCILIYIYMFNLVAVIMYKFINSFSLYLKIYQTLYAWDIIKMASVPY